MAQRIAKQFPLEVEYEHLDDLEDFPLRFQLLKSGILLVVIALNVLALRINEIYGLVDVPVDFSRRFHDCLVVNIVAEEHAIVAILEEESVCHLVKAVLLLTLQGEILHPQVSLDIRDFGTLKYDRL